MRESDELIAKATECYERGDYAAAIERLTRAVERDRTNAVAYHKRGWARAHIGDIEGELADWSKALELDPSFDAAYADRSVARTALRDYSGAMADGQTAILLNPSRRVLLDPILERLRSKIQEGAAALSDGDEKVLGVDRRDFVRAVAGVAVATVGLSLVGCGRGGSATERKGVRWGMIIDLRRCVGCKACTVACKAENHTPPGVAYTVVMEEEAGEFPHVTRRFLPRPCMQCANSSCTQVCPTSATYHRPDGIVVVDYDKCIGCRYCIAACPYGARSFDYGHNYAEKLTPHERQPSPEYGQHRLREKGKSPEGNVRKCTFCLHRLVNGLSPACAETCIGHAIHFGNLADPEAKCTVHGESLHELLASRSHMRLKEELGNEPAVHYLT